MTEDQEKALRRLAAAVLVTAVDDLYRYRDFLEPENLQKRLSRVNKALGRNRLRSLYALQKDTADVLAEQQVLHDFLQGSSIFHEILRLDFRHTAKLLHEDSPVMTERVVKRRGRHSQTGDKLRAARGLR